MFTTRRGLSLCAVLLPGLLGFGAVLPLFPQDADWIRLEQGKAAFESRNLGQALEILVSLVDSTEDYPEAEYWLGRVYQAEGQRILAEQQFRLALDSALFFRVPDDRYLVEYDLAQLILNQGERVLEAEAILQGIRERERPTTPRLVSLESSYIRTLSDQGLDELLYLYRDELGPSLRARAILGELAWTRGLYRSSLLHSLWVCLSMLSTVARHVRDRDTE